MDFKPEQLFLLARCSIESKWGVDKTTAPVIDDIIRENSASFVTLTISGVLRGCVGSLVSYQPLYKDIESNSYAAAFKDPRFPPLTIDEYENIEVEVSILSTPEEIFFDTVDELKEIVRPHIDGIIFSVFGRKATFLPQVWDQLSDFDSFFSHLSLKAGLGPEPDFENCSISRYQVERFHE
jgi:AmmeMemoRadiSam system protein A